MTTDAAPTCAGCQRPDPIPDTVCERCRQDAAERLAAFPRLHPRVVLAQIPGSTTGQAGSGGKRSASPLPVRAEALSLLAAGCLDIEDEDLPIQTGTLPVSLWLNAWAGDWTERGYHAQRPRVYVEGGWPARAGDAAVVRQLLTGAGKLVIGHEPDGTPIRRPIHDTLEAEYLARFGTADGELLTRTVMYLANRLDAACDLHPQIGDFLLGLKTLHAACQTVVGDRPGLMWLGRCPQPRLDLFTGVEGRCGAALWQDPWATVVTCPRCRTQWEEADWLKLAGLIRANATPAPAVEHRYQTTLVIPLANDDGGVDGGFWAAACSCGWRATMAENFDNPHGAWAAHRDAATADAA